jgi:hypothetical protein
MRPVILSPILFVSACSAPGGPYPSLQPRAAETIDPRLPVARPLNDKPVSSELADRLAALVGQARGGSGAFDKAADRAERLAATAGAPRSESWIAAQQALSAAVAAREPAARAAGDIDAIAASALQNKGGIAPADFEAIKQAADVVGTIGTRQAARVAAIQRRLGS